jgi:hypothetical protein
MGHEAAPYALDCLQAPFGSAPEAESSNRLKTVACGEDQTLVSVVCSSGASDGVGYPAATQTERRGSLIRSRML